MSTFVDVNSMIPGIFKDGNKYGFRANVPGGGGRQVKRRGFLTQDAAYRARVNFLGGVMSPTGSTRTVASWFAEFAEIKRMEKRATTAAGYAKCLNRMLPYIGDIVLSDLNESHLRAAYQEMVPRYATSTILTVHTRVRTALKQATREGLIPRCPADNVSSPKGKTTRKRRVWSFRQLMIFAEYTASQRDAAMWAVFMTTGLRRGEVCGLMWPKVDLDEGAATIDWQRTKTAYGVIVEGPTKTEDGERIAPLSPRVVTALRAWRAGQSALRLTKGEAWRGGDYVFTSKFGLPYFPDSLNQRLNVLTKAAGLPVITPHELRHTFATRAIEDGADIKVLSKLLGHSRVEITMNLYVHPSEEQAREVNESLSDRIFG